jgi:hypothetical protein
MANARTIHLAQQRARMTAFRVRRRTGSMQLKINITREQMRAVRCGCRNFIAGLGGGRSLEYLAAMREARRAIRILDCLRRGHEPPIAFRP